MELDYFDLRRAMVVASATGGMDKIERSLRLLGAAEFAASELSTRSAPAPVMVTELHWALACQYTMCAFGERPRCLKERSDLRLWHVTVYPGYMQKLASLGFEDVGILGGSFHEATQALACYLVKYSAGERIVKSGALRLQSGTWRERLRLLEVGVQEGEIELPAPEMSVFGEYRFAGGLSSYLESKG